jgi:hypothetical protein
MMDDGIKSVQYKVSREDWESDLRIMMSHIKFYEKGGTPYQYEQLNVDGNPVHHLITGPKKVRCIRRQKGMWLEGAHWEGHCPAVIYGEEIEVMAKEKGKTVKTTAEKRKAEISTAKLSPKSFVADPEQTKTKSQRKSEPRPCACQCGQMTGGGYFFPGHDSKVKSIFSRLFKGTMLKKDVNAVVLKMYGIWDKDKSVPVKDIAKQVLG